MKILVWRTLLITSILITLVSSITRFTHAAEPIHYPKTVYMTDEDKLLAEQMASRDKDWRMGAVVYQVLVDRFAPSQNLESKLHLYQPPKTLKNWDETPAQGSPKEGTAFWSHELDFWGGDLNSLMGKLDYIKNLNVDVLYLNPIHHAFSNHKYDAIDYHKVSPEFGDREDVLRLAKLLHQRDMKLVLDGVFNHMGIQSPVFQQALNDKTSLYRDWFLFSDAYKNGYRSWADSRTLPELHLENPEVRKHIYDAPDSVIQSYLQQGVDGWRLDVAFDIGPTYLKEITHAAHSVNEKALVVGEIWNYPDGWSDTVDGVMNFTLRQILLRMLDGSIDANTAETMTSQMVKDTGIETMLKSWLLIDNHDTPSLRNLLPNTWQEEMAQTLLVTLPGSPNFYYGVELGLDGGEDPANRGPMRWEQATDDNPYLLQFKSLTKLRKQNRAMRIGNYRSVISKDLFAFERYTDKALETVFVFANPSERAVRESLMIRNHKLMNGTKLVDLFSGNEVAEIRSGVVTLDIPPQSIWVLKPVDYEMEWTPYERIY